MGMFGLLDSRNRNGVSLILTVEADAAKIDSMGEPVESVRVGIEPPFSAWVADVSASVTSDA